MQKIEDGRYNSVSDFLASLSELRNPKNATIAKQLEKDDDGFFGASCKTLKDVIALTDQGWPEGQQTVSDLIDQAAAIEATPQDRRRRLSRGNTGDSLDISAVYRGRLDIAWSRAVRQPSYAPQKIDILANMICQSNDPPSVLQWRGAAAAALADKLTACGYMVRIVVGNGGVVRASQEKASLRVVVKDYDKPLDVATLAAITLPGFARALCIAWKCRHAAGSYDMRSTSVGQSIVEPGEIVLSHKVRDRDTAINFIDEQIAAINNAQAA